MYFIIFYYSVQARELFEPARVELYLDLTILTSFFLFISIQVKETNFEFGGIIEHEYDIPQIRLQEFLLDIHCNEIQELWEVTYIMATSISKPHYVVILKGRGNHVVF